MRTRELFVSPLYRSIALSAVLSLVASVPLAQASAHSTTPVQPGVQTSRSIPLAFERNEGQYSHEVEFLARTRAYSVAVNGHGLVFHLPSDTPGVPISISFDHALPTAAHGVDELPFRTNLFVGSDASTWRTGVRNYSSIALDHLYPGIDTVFYANQEQIEHDFHISAGADPRQIVMLLQGAKQFHQDSSGDLILETTDGELRLKKPVAYQTDPQGKRTEVAAQFVLGKTVSGARNLHFVLGSYDHSRELVIDPVILYASFAAGSEGSTASALAADTVGNVYLTGTTNSTIDSFNLPASASHSFSGGTAPGNYAFVLKFNQASYGSAPAWITYYSGGSASTITATASAVSGSAATSILYIGGSTNASALPAASASTIPNPTGGNVGYVFGLKASDGSLLGTNLIYADAHVATNKVKVQSLAVDNAGNVYAAGSLTSTGINDGLVEVNGFTSAPAVPLTPASDGVTTNAYVAEYLPGTFSGTPAFFSYIQANAATSTQIDAIAVNGTHVYLAGEAGGPAVGSFAVPSALFTGPYSFAAGSLDAFVMDISIGATSPTVNSFTWFDAPGTNQPVSVGFDSSSNVYVFGNTTKAFAAKPALPTCATANLLCKFGSATSSGYIVKIGGTVPVKPLAYVFLKGSNSTNKLYSGAVASDGSVFAGGQTDAPWFSNSGTTFPFAYTPIAPAALPSTASPAPKAYLPALQDLTGNGKLRGYVASLDATLSTVRYVANIGNLAGATPVASDSVVALALDASSNVFLAANIAKGSAPYTAKDAYEPAGSATGSFSAYLAEIASTTNATGSGINFAKGNVVTNGASQTYTWPLTATAGSPVSDNVEIEISASPGPAIDFTASTTSVKLLNEETEVGFCQQSASGASCVLPSFPLNGATLLPVELQVVTATPPTVPSILTVTAIATSPDSASQPQPVIQTKPVLKPQPVPLPLKGVDTATATSAVAAAYSPYTQVTYPIALMNAGTADASNVSLTLTKPSGFVVLSATPSFSDASSVASVSCANDGTSCTVPTLAKGVTFLYTITGYYDDTTIPALKNTTSAGAFQLSYGATLLPTAAISIPTSTKVSRAVELSLHSGVAPVPPGTTLDSSISYVYTLTNSGPGIAHNVTLSAPTLPAGLSSTSFIATFASGNQVACTASATSAFNCPGITVSPDAPTIITVNVLYKDLAPLPDAVPSPLSSASVTVNATASADPAYSIVFTSGAQPTGSLKATLNTTATITRKPVLQVHPIAPASTAPVCIDPVTKTNLTPCTYLDNQNLYPGSGKTPNEIGTYSFTVSNTGNTSTGTEIDIPLPVTADGGIFNVLTAVVTHQPAGTQWACSTTTTTIACGTKLTSDIAKSTSDFTVTFTGYFGPKAVTPLEAFSKASSVLVGISAETNTYSYTATTGLGVLTAFRSSHLIVNKTVSLAATKPYNPTYPYPNLDERPDLKTFGHNDEIEYAVAIGNSGPDDAPSSTSTTKQGVLVTDTLPPYFTVEKIYLFDATYTASSSPNVVPGGHQIAGLTCVQGSSYPGAALTLPYASGGGTVPATFTCQLPTTLAADKSTATSTVHAPGASRLVIVYQGKFQDNAPAADNITAKSKFDVDPLTIQSSAPGAATATTIDAVDSIVTVPPALQPNQNLMVAKYTIQRSAQLLFAKSSAQPYYAPTGTPTGPDANLSIDSYTSAAEIGEAQKDSNSSTAVFNCIRYKFYVVNAGPNRARVPSLTLTLPGAPGSTSQPVAPQNFVSNSNETAYLTSAAPVDSALSSSCSSRYGVPAAKLVAGVVTTAAAPANTGTQSFLPLTQDAKSMMVADFDGYYDVNTLNWNLDKALPCHGNCGLRTPILSPTLDSLSDAGILPSNLGLSTYPTTLVAIPTVAVVNTPFNLAANVTFHVTPYGIDGNRVSRIAMGKVPMPGGVTSEDHSGGIAPGTLMPYGTSPWYKLHPPATATAASLYQPGAKPVSYALSSTATVAQPEVCVFNQGDAANIIAGISPKLTLSDQFVKPERALLWVVAGLPTGTTGNPVPHLTADMSHFGSGDITSSVYAGNATGIYPMDPAFGAIPSATQLSPEVQPGELCGKLASLPGKATPATLAVLEPVNFPPVVVATLNTSAASGKGASQQAYTISVTLPTADILAAAPAQSILKVTYDYNDADPCYNVPSKADPTKSARGVCSDNPYLQTFVFGGGNIFGLPASQASSAIPIADWTTGTSSSLTAPYTRGFNGPLNAQIYVAAADKAIYEPGTPNFLSSTNAPSCDTGFTSSTYTPTPSPCPDEPAYSTLGLPAGLPPQSYVPSFTTYTPTTKYLVGAVGSASLTATGSGGATSGLTSLPLPSDPMEQPVYNPNVPTQFPDLPPVAISAGQSIGFSWYWITQYQSKSPINLTCELRSATPMPAGMSCLIPPTYMNTPTAPAKSGVIIFIATGAAGVKAGTQPVSYTFDAFASGVGLDGKAFKIYTGTFTVVVHPNN